MILWSEIVFIYTCIYRKEKSFHSNEILATSHTGSAEMTDSNATADEKSLY